MNEFGFGGVQACSMNAPQLRTKMMGKSLGLMMGLGLGLTVQPARAALAGAWETFFDLYNTETWLVDDGVTTTAQTPPHWSGTPVDLEYAYFTYASDNAVSFYADEYVGEGAFTGDYQAEGIAGVACDVFIGKLADLDSIDCSVYANGPGGMKYYYSEPYYVEDFASGGWWSLWFSFDRLWSYYNGTSWVDVDGRSLTAIEELDFTFYPVSGSAGGSRVGIDDVTLEPSVVAPQLTTSVTAGSPRNFRLAFTPGPGLEYRIEKMQKPPASGWDAVTGQTQITLPGEHVFLTPVGPDRELFRVAAEPFYTTIITP